jgi:AbrB family looped-hinge helix DNA binding protein
MAWKLPVEAPMSSVTVSPKYQIVIPKEVRKALDIRPGGKLLVIQHASYIEVIPARDVKKMRGFAKGMSVTLTRDKE